VKTGKAKYLWITATPLAWLLVVTSTAAFEKLLSPELRIGFLAHAKDLSDRLASGSLSADMAAKAPRLIFNDYLDAGLTILFVTVSWILVFETVRVCRANLSKGSGHSHGDVDGDECTSCAG
jgi:carbon starvation protein